MIILWWTCFSSQNECWHEGVSRSPTARPVVPNFNHIGSCLHILPLAPHPPFHPQHEAVTTEADTCRVVLWAHRRGRSHEIFIDFRPVLQERWLKPWKGVSETPKVDTATFASPSHAWGRFIHSNPSSPKATAVLRRESDTILCLRPTVRGRSFF